MRDFIKLRYYDELKEVRKELKSILTKNKIKASVRGGQGTSLFWTDISYNRKKQQQWNDKQLNFLNKEMGFRVGHPQNTITIEMSQLVPKVKGYQYRGFKRTPKYQKLKQDFTTEAMKHYDEGTCVLGAGTIIQKNGVPIDFWRQHGQGETRDWIAQKIMKNRAKALGLTFKHEGGRMD